MSNIFLPVPQPASTSRSSRQALAQTSVSRVPQSSVVVSTLASAPRENTRLQVFLDPTGEEAQTAELIGNNTNEWSDLGTRKTRIKENALEVKKMAGSTIKQPGKSKRLAAASLSGTGIASNSKISVFRDPVPRDVPISPDPSSSSQKSSGAGSGLNPTSTKGFTPFEDEQPKENPFVRLSREQPVTPVATFTPFRDEVSLSHPHVRSNTDMHRLVRGIISGCYRTYRYFDHENQEHP